MTEGASSTERPIMFVSTTLYLLVVVGVAVAATTILLDQPLDELLPYSVAAGILVVPFSWWVTGRGSGFDGFGPGNIAFLAGVGLVIAVGFPAASTFGLDDSIVAFLVLVIVAITLGRVFERALIRRFGDYWGEELDDAEPAPANEEPADEESEQAVDEGFTDDDGNRESAASDGASESESEPASTDDPDAASPPTDDPDDTSSQTDENEAGNDTSAPTDKNEGRDAASAPTDKNEGRDAASAPTDENEAGDDDSATSEDADERIE